MKKLTYLLVLILFISCKEKIDCTLYNEKTIPKNLDEALYVLDCNLDEKFKLNFKNKEESNAVTGLHFGLGMNIRNNWGLWDRKGYLYEYFENMEIYHPDDISSVILTSYHRMLNDKPIEINKQAKHYQEYWEEVNNSQRKEYSKIFKKFKINDTLNFKYLRGYISEKQKELAETEKCIAKGVLLEKRETDFHLKIKIIETCNDKGIYADLDWDELNRKITKVGDIRWNFYNDWEPSFIESP